MHIRPYCIQCTLRQVYDALTRSTDDIKLQKRIIKEVLKVLVTIDWAITPVELSNIVQNIVKKMTGVADPFREYKRHATVNALKIFPSLQRIVESKKTPLEKLETAVKLSIAGNIIDVGPGIPVELNATMNKILQSNIDRKLLTDFMKELEKASSVCFIGDNAGEIVFDKLLLITLKQLNKSLDITFIVKKGALLNDAMLKDAEEASLKEIATIREIPIGVEISDFNKMLEEWTEFCLSYDVVISKGQGNFEIFHQNPFYFLLIVKCKTISECFNLSIGTPIFIKGPILPQF